MNDLSEWFLFHRERELICLVIVVEALTSIPVSNAVEAATKGITGGVV